MTKRAWTMGCLVLAELAGLAVAYQVFTDFTCSATDSEAACRFIRSLVARAIVILPALGLFAWLRRLSFSRRSSLSLTYMITRWPPGVGLAVHSVAGLVPLRWARGHLWLVTHLLGLSLLLQPLLWVAASDPQVFFERSVGSWVLGSTFAAIGAVAWVAPISEWKGWASKNGYAFLLIGTVAFFVPDIAGLVEPLWHWQVLTTATFEAVAKLLLLVGTETYSDPTTYVIGLGDFYVRVAQQCSGIEGFALIASFVALYGFLFSRDLQLSRYWLIVTPLALAASWLLNVLRIFALIVIGAWFSPEIAVNGFHSYAGWLLFTVLAVTIIFLVHITPVLHRTPALPRGMSLRDDWLAAQILPFACLMVTGVASSAFTVDPELAVPYRALFLSLVLAFFWAHYRRLTWSRDLASLASGALVGLVWIVTAPPGSNGGVLLETLRDYGPNAFAAWVLFRILFTAILVPLTEELFFRGYLLGRLDFGGLVGKLFAVMVSSGLFALLHGRWIEAWAAGVVFALLMLRRDRLGDAIIAHVTANAVIAVSAVLRGDWAII